MSSDQRFTTITSTGQAKTISGGSVANSVVSLAQLGNKVGFIGSTTLQDIINNFSVDGTGDISDLGLDTMIDGELLENYGEGTEWYVRTDVAEF